MWHLRIATQSVIALSNSALNFARISAATSQVSKTFNNTGAHTGSLWTSTGKLLATGTFANETDGGWQTLTFSSPVPIAPNTTYVASYHTNSGSFAVALGYFGTHGTDNAPLHALTYGVDGPNGVYLNGPGGSFPSGGSMGDNYRVEVLFVR